MMKTPLQLQDLVSELVHLYPGAHLELDPLPSGVCFLWVALGERNFALEYHPSQGTGVSENTPHTTPFEGHENVFKSLNEAVDYFKKTLSTAASASQSAGFAGASIN